MRYLSVCSGIEAASVAWLPLGWQPVGFSEIDPFPCALLRHYWPSIPNHGDLNRFAEWPDADIDLLVGGTPCQSFSVAGLRGGLADPRGNLALEYLQCARRYRPRWLLWENVPGVLQTGQGRAFATFIGILSELGYGFAWAVLDAQHFGLAQRRKRLFLVGNSRGWAAAASVLFDTACMRGDPAPRREARQGAPAKALRSTDGGISREDADELVVMAHGQANAEISSDGGSPTLTCNHEAPILAYDETVITSSGNRSNPRPGDPCHTLHDPSRTILAFSDVADPISANERSTWSHEGDNNFRMRNVAYAPGFVRRLTPRECERLQGFPDDFTLIPYGSKGKLAKDGPRYKAIGNSMAVPVMRWIGERMQKVDSMMRLAA